MMKINLLGQPTPTTKAVSAPTSMAARQGIVFGVALVVCMGIAGLFWYYWGHQLTYEQAQLSKEQSRQKELAGVKAQNTLYQQQLKQLQERINTIQKLQTARTGPVDLMMGLGDTVNHTKDLFLTSVDPRGNALDIKGVSESVHAIADFIAALNKSSKFESVQLREYYQDNLESRTRFRFELFTTYKPPAPPALPGGANQPATPTAAGHGR